MHKLLSLIFVFAAVAVLANQDVHIRCDTHDSHPERDIDRDLRERLNNQTVLFHFDERQHGPMRGNGTREEHSRKRATLVNGITVINVYFHVINQGPGYVNGDITDQMIADQITELNSAVDGSGFSFILKATTRTTNSMWFNVAQGSTQESLTKQALHAGTGQDLNIYSVNPPTGVVGWGTYPWNYAAMPWYDGITIRYSTVPGGDYFPYNQGHTGDHELGHWFGLYHTFQGGCCDGTSCGDYVADTPAEATPASGCQAGRDTCSSGGQDPIGDYMDYTTDACTYYFTWGQAARMTQMWTAYRAGK